MRREKENLIIDLKMDFAVEIVNFTDDLENRKKYDLAGQLFLSGTSIGANAKETQCAEGRRDFVHKMKIAAREAEETSYWLELCGRCEGFPTNKELETKVLVIKKVLSKIITSSKSAHQHIIN